MLANTNIFNADISLFDFTLIQIFAISGGGDSQPDLKFINVEKNYDLINESLNYLSTKTPGGSGIYLFWLLDNPSKCYIGSSINLKRRFNDHYKNYLKNITYIFKKFLYKD